MNCRFCKHPLVHVFVDLGHAPPSNAYLTAEQLERPEVTYPLKVFVCDNCWLVQIPLHASAREIFAADYAYFSSVSATWVEHARRYVGTVVERFQLDRSDFVVEVASNDGYLLQFVTKHNIPCLGIEPTASTATAARMRGIETLEEFFGEDLGRQIARQRRPASLIVANNVLAHVPDINDFVSGIRELLAPRGVATLEFPHLMRLVEHTQFDTIYHEHFSYLSLTTARQVFRSQGLEIFDVEELPTHGGSLRIYAQRADSPREPVRASVDEFAAEEDRRGMRTLAYYAGFQDRVTRVKNELVAFLLEQKRSGATVMGYGAAAKGNTLLNYAGIRADLLPYVCDAAPSKQGKYLPGSHIPIVSPEAIWRDRPAHVLLLPWNLREEITRALDYIRNWQGQFSVAVPQMDVF